ncbi:type II toxin-antitoxin system RelE/ParE family toxin [Phyllobacterium bourgognense]|uniref:Plasmid stabilization system protein ParE n=1 Tax=Phyllobacterium bourgognense TaxID=314236 RepID=A0A368YXT4_9HYPH|nr:type II toxin-antitoxin system RelE/ParE family toxin [Phyllobacterium bourgognense]RCW82994.1 plasmid stabilization system protein ParE [Phyllobacterium bourgognense]
MKPVSIKLSPQAERWLLEEITYIAEHSPSAAANITGKMRDLQKRLAEFPDLGVRGAILGTRRIVVKPYVLTTRFKDGVLEIAAIRHSKQGDAYTPTELAAEIDRDPEATLT